MIGTRSITMNIDMVQKQYLIFISINYIIVPYTRLHHDILHWQQLNYSITYSELLGKLHRMTKNPKNKNHQQFTTNVTNQNLVEQNSFNKPTIGDYIQNWLLWPHGPIRAWHMDKKLLVPLYPTNSFTLSTFCFGPLFLDFAQWILSNHVAQKLSSCIVSSLVINIYVTITHGLLAFYLRTLFLESMQWILSNCVMHKIPSCDVTSSFLNIFVAIACGVFNKTLTKTHFITNMPPTLLVAHHQATFLCFSGDLQRRDFLLCFVDKVIKTLIHFFNRMFCFNNFLNYLLCGLYRCSYIQ